MPDENTRLQGGKAQQKTLPSSGYKVRIKPMRTREMLKLIKILTAGAPNILRQIQFTNMDSITIGTQLMGSLMMAIPEAEDEVIDFISAVTELDGIPGLSDAIKQEDEKALSALREFYQYMDNPELEDTIEILQAVIDAEKDDLVSLGKRLMAAIGISLKAASLTDQMSTSSVDTPEPST